MSDINKQKAICSQVRRDIIRMIHSVASGHPGGSLGCVEFMVALYEQMNFSAKPFSENGLEEDVFFLSNGHIAPVWYSVLARNGFFPVSELGTLRKLGTRLQGHPAVLEGLPGIRMASGSLGQGLSCAAGAALAKKLNSDDKLVYCLCGDGEIEEGQIWEAALFSAQHKIDNLILCIDNNGRQIDGDVKEVMNIDPLDDKWKAFGWDVLILDNGNDIEAMNEMLDEAKEHTNMGRPVVIIMKTEMGMGVDFMMGTHKWHGVAPDDEQCKAALAQLKETLGDY